MAIFQLDQKHGVGFGLDDLALTATDRELGDEIQAKHDSLTGLYNRGEFERQLETLAQGLASKPIESRYGFHVVNVTRRIDGKELEYSMVEDKVRGYLTHRASYLAIQVFIQGLVEKADIKGIEIRFIEENIVV